MNDAALMEKQYASKISYWMISLMHDNCLLPLIKNPDKILKNAGIKPGHQVLEVGCGPGFYTMAASRVVGERGQVYALDVNPYAIQKIEQKIAEAKADNITPMCANAACTGLPGQSLDSAFLFGLPRVVGGMKGLLSELYRVLKPGGVATFQRVRTSEEALKQAVEKAGFELHKQNGRLMIFVRK